MGSEISTTREGDAFRVVVRPRRRLAPAEEAVTITAAGRTERLPVALRPADARATLSGRAGYLASAGGLRSAYAGVEAALWPDGWRRLGLAVEAGAFSFDRTDGVLAAGAAAELRGRVRYLDLAAGESREHVWTHRATQPGVLEFEARAGGLEPSTGTAITAAKTRTSAQVQESSARCAP